ncbi:hypothetical protein CLIM01_08430 [Colletotrichum limetticola]|uniref:Uncharacterized protein n=1 Tax=Colletotrichum limetticola TaxID=1209924 RepID=A0ABQ9PRQ2_9PEZI|nr:hypothetical protein CLIM01_08430 [Colletotrichum limetticola]
MFSLILRILSLPLIPFRRYLPPSPPSALPQPRSPPKDNNKTSSSSSPSSAPAPLVKSTAMYVYLGKLDWKPYGQDETFVITLPNGPARAGDPAYLFSQWTKDARGAQKANWFLNLVVDKVSKTASGDDVFTLKNSHYYSWEITTQKVYGELKVTMSNPNKDKSTMTFNRIWKSESQTPAGSLRIWTGKMNWPNYATNEMATFIVPEGFGKDKPVLAVWQWTKNGQGKPKNPNVHVAKQSILSSPEKSVKFEYDSFYHLTCTWQEQTERLSVHMKGRDSEANVSQELGEYALAVHLDRHSHDFNPPESTPNKAEVAHRLPQPEPSLPRILAPMPFPKGLVDTLTHAQSFIDQAGYLAKYAEQRFQALDTDLHARDHQLTAAKSQIDDLTNSRANLASDVKKKEAEITVLEGKLSKANVELEEQEAALAKLRDDINTGKKHDADDHREIKDLRAARLKLRRKLDRVVPELDGANARIAALVKEIQDLTVERDDLKSKLSVQVKLNGDLTTQVGDLTKARDDFKSMWEAAQKANEKLQRSETSHQALVIELRAKLEEAHKEKQDAIKDADESVDKERGAKNKALEALAKADKALYYAKLNKQAYWDMLNDNDLVPPPDVEEKPLAAGQKTAVKA